MNLKVGSLIALAAAVLAFGLSAVSASPVVPSVEITGGPQPGNYCAGGTLNVPTYNNISGFGYSSVYVTSVYIQGQGGPSPLAQFQLDYNGVVAQGESQVMIQFTPTLNGQPVVMPSDLPLYLVIQTFAAPGQPTFFASISINCATGAIGGLNNQPVNQPPQPQPTLIPNLRVPVAGPVRVPPGVPVMQLPNNVQINPQLNPQLNVNVFGN